MNKTLALVVVTAWTAGLLSGCARPQASTTDKPAATSPGPTASTAVGESAGKPAGDASAPADKGETAPVAASAEKTLPGESTRAPLAPVEAAKKVSVDQLPGSMVIVSVAGRPITVGEYRRMFKLQQLQLQNAVSADPMARARVLQEAKKRGVELTASEKEALLSVARGGKPASSEEFKKLLKDKSITEADFNREVVEVGTAIKCVNVMLQGSLLNDLVNREILCAAGTQAGLMKKAGDRYFEIKRGASYKQLLEATRISPDELKDELIKSELTKLMIERIQKRAAVTDQDVADYYNKNKQLFKHNERVRLSQIIIAAPSQDMGPIQSVRTQLKKANPKLEGKELDAAVALTMDALKRRAQEALAKAKAGENFAELVNKYTDDIPAKVGKTGGDIGYREKGQLPPQLASAIWPLKDGDIYPGLVQSDLGFQIFKVVKHEPAGTAPLAEVKELVALGLKAQKADQVLSGWLRDRRRTTQIVLDPQFGALVAAEQAKTSKTSALDSLPR